MEILLVENEHIFNSVSFEHLSSNVINLYHDKNLFTITINDTINTKKKSLDTTGLECLDASDLDHLQA